MVLFGTPKTPQRNSSGSSQGAKDDTGATNNDKGGSSKLRKVFSLGSNPEASPSGTNPQSLEFVVNIDKSSGSSLGLGVDSSLRIDAVEAEGLVATWNTSCPSKEVKVGQRIVQVNGATDLAEMIEKLKLQEPLEIQIASEVSAREASPQASPQASPPQASPPQASPPQASPSPDAASVATPADAGQLLAAASVRLAATAPPSFPSLNQEPPADSKFKTWSTEVAAEETPAPDSPGIRNLKNTFDASTDFSCGTDGKDGDLVELPSASAHTSLLSHSSLTPSRENSANLHSLLHTGLSPGELSALREFEAMKKGNASAPPPLSTMPQSSVPEVRLIRPNSSPPDDDDLNDIATVHSSLATSTPSFHQTLRQHDGSCPPGAKQTVGATASNNSVLSDQLMHGAGELPGAVGFLRAGPFWTCGSTPNIRSARQNHGTSKRSSPTAMCGIFRSSASQAAANTLSGPLDLSSRISGVLGNCINLLSSAIDIPTDPEPPEDELTTVLMETKEQRLQWRDFLSEAVSKCRAGALYTSFDVEPDPPKYSRPPLSTVPKVDAVVRSYRQSGKSPPHVVAPNGAGFCQSGPPALCATGSGAKPRWVYQGGALVDPCGTSQPSSASSSTAKPAGAAAGKDGDVERSAQSENVKATEVLGAPVQADRRRPSGERALLASENHSNDLKPRSDAGPTEATPSRLGVGSKAADREVNGQRSTDATPVNGVALTAAQTSSASSSSAPQADEHAAEPDDRPSASSDSSSGCLNLVQGGNKLPPCYDSTQGSSEQLFDKVNTGKSSSAPAASSPPASSPVSRPAPAG